MKESILVWLQIRLTEAANRWLAERLDLVSQPFDSRALYIAFGMMPRKLGKSELGLTAAELAQAQALRTGWRPDLWSLADTGRVLLLLTAAEHDATAFPNRLTELIRNADIGESISLYRGLAVYPHAADLIEQAAEGVRSSMQVVFDAVALDNPYPREHFDQPRWNQMVLKALFVGSPLNRIQGLDESTNAELALMLRNFLKERWAAGRQVSPEIWRCLGPHADAGMLEELHKTLQHEDPLQRWAAALALSSNPLPQAAECLASQPELASQIQRGRLTWPRLSAELSARG